MTNNKIKSILLSGLLLVGIAFSLVLIKQRQELRRSAYFSQTTLSLTSTTNKFKIGDEFLVALSFNAQSKVNNVKTYVCFSNNVALVGTRAPDSIVVNKNAGISVIDLALIKDDGGRKCLSFSVGGGPLDEDIWKEAAKAADIKFKAVADGVGKIEMIKSYSMVNGFNPSGGIDNSFEITGLTNFDYTVGQTTEAPKWTEWSECSKSCGGGTQTGKCVDSTGKEVSGCEGSNSQSCNTNACGTGGVFYKLTPESASYTVGTQFSLVLGVNTGEEPMATGDVQLKFDSSILEIVSVEKLPSMERAFPYREDTKFHIDNSLGKLEIVLANETNTLLEGSPANGDLFRVNFRAKKEGSANVSFDCVDGNEKDSNILIGKGRDKIECNLNKNANLEIISGSAQKWSRGGCDTSTGNYICTASNTGLYDTQSLCLRNNNQRCGDSNPNPDPEPKGLGIRFRYTFIGVRSGSYSNGKKISACAIEWPVQVVVKDNLGREMDLVTIKSNPVGEKSFGKDAAGNDISLITYQAAVSVDTSKISSNNLSVFIKGSKHMMSKYGKDGQSAFYNQKDGSISAFDLSSNSSKFIDFTAHPVLAGDIDSSGKINAEDFSVVKKEAKDRKNVEEGNSFPSDLNGDCVVNAVDTQILLISLSAREDQLY